MLECDYGRSGIMATELAKAYVQIIPSADGIKTECRAVAEKQEKAGRVRDGVKS